MSTALRVVPISHDWSDTELVAAVRHGSDAAFAELYSRYSPRICAYVHGMVRDHGRAEDITQEIFIAALRRMRETERPIVFKPWIYEIAKNACIDNFRRARRAQEVSIDADHDLSSADRGRLTAVTTLEAELETKQALENLRGAFGGLSESHHEILVLRELEGRSYNDIGERLGMSRPVVESTLFRARRRLAEEYEELASGRRCEFVRKLVESGPQFSLGIRDRRRMARHFAHCQACRAHARLAGFDESILGTPRVTTRIAAALPIALLRARWGSLEHGVVGAPRGRPGPLTFRSIHSLARSSDQILGAGTGAGRAGATAAALVLASVGGGIATVTSSQGSHVSGARAAVSAGPHARAGAGPAAGLKTIVIPGHGRTAAGPSGVRASSSSTSARTAASRAGAAAGSPVRGAGSSTSAGKVGAGGHVGAGMGVAGGQTGAGTSAAAGQAGAGGAGTGDPAGPGISVPPPTVPGVAGGPTGTGTGGFPGGTPKLPVPGMPQLPAPATPQLPAGTPAGTISNTLGAVGVSVPKLPPIGGTGTTTNKSRPLTGVIHAVAGALGQ